MPGFLQTVLNEKDPRFNAGLVQLERETGCHGIDTRLIGDVIANAHNVMRSLGLDINDTTGVELYNALSEVIKSGKGEQVLANTNYTFLIIESEVISFNLIDAIENVHHELQFNNRTMRNGQRCLRAELAERYLEYANKNNALAHEVVNSVKIIE
jgi:hypothetical protein